MKLPSNRLDRILFILMWIFYAWCMVTGIYAILKLSGIDPEANVLIPFLMGFLAILSTLLLKVGRIQGKNRRMISVLCT